MSQYDFEWDPAKERSNRTKHGVGFEQAATVFRDPRALTVFDDTHSETEERWVTLGLSSSGRLLVVHHTFREEAAGQARIRIISSRKATHNETKQYGESK
jgi:uncharacterized DUF497 family protein